MKTELKNQIGTAMMVVLLFGAPVLWLLEIYGIF